MEVDVGTVGVEVTEAAISVGVPDGVLGPGVDEAAGGLPVRNPARVCASIVASALTPVRLKLDRSHA